jgi:hypothetical protein
MRVSLGPALGLLVGSLLVHVTMRPPGSAVAGAWRQSSGNMLGQWEVDLKCEVDGQDPQNAGELGGPSQTVSFHHTLPGKATRYLPRKIYWQRVLDEAILMDPNIPGYSVKLCNSGIMSIIARNDSVDLILGDIMIPYHCSVLTIYGTGG